MTTRDDSAMRTDCRDTLKARQTAHFMRTVSDVAAAGAIAIHYIACADLAMDLRQLIVACDGRKMPRATRDTILHMRKEIERHHLDAFGTTIIRSDNDQTNTTK